VSAATRSTRRWSAFDSRRRLLDRAAELLQALLLVDVSDEGEENLRAEMEVGALLGRQAASYAAAVPDPRR
jgi:hypothetical protein